MASKQIATRDLLAINSLQEAFRLFGVKDGDIVDVREQVIMTSAIGDELKKVKQALVKRAEYDGAAKVRDRLAALQSEFEEMQRNREEDRQREEVEKFEMASQRLTQLDARTTEKLMEETEKECEARIKALRHAHELQRDQLERYIADMHRPRVRYSKTLLEMMHSEKHLAKLNQFEDAKALNKRIASLLPREMEKHDKSLEHREAVLRGNLRKRQAFELAKLQERLVDIRLRMHRANSRRSEVTKMRLGHHKADMGNRHTVESSSVPKFCAVQGGKVRPVVKKREHYMEHDATFRGSQLLKSVQGDVIKDVVSLSSLCDFSKEMPCGTSEYTT